LFSESFEARAFGLIESLEHGPLLGGPRIEPTVAQDVRQFVSEGARNQLGQSWIVRATWAGAIGVYWTQGVDTARIESVVEHPVAAAWAVAEDLLVALGAQGSRYLQLAVAGASFRPNPNPQMVMNVPTAALHPIPPTVVGRGPLSPGVNRTILDSIERELRRATGEMAYEDARD
jgi:hypothetical protein